MKREGVVRWSVALLAPLLIAFGTSCSEDTGGTGLPGNGSGADPRIGTAATAINGAVGTFLVSNQDSFESLLVFGGFFGTALTAPPALGASLGRHLSVLQTSCFAAPGTTYEFDTDQYVYVASARTGAPAEGVRFILYELDATSQPAIPLVEIGYADFVCTATSPNHFALSLDLVVGGVTVFALDVADANISATSAAMFYDVTLRDPSGAQQLSGGGYANRNSTTESLGLGLDVQTNLTVSFSVQDNGASGGSIFATVVGGDPNVQLDFTIDASADFDGAGNLNGAITFTDFMGLDLIACVGGTRDAPVMSDATTGGCTAETAVPVSLSAAELLAIGAAFNGIGSAHESVRTIIDGAIEAILNLGPA